MCRDQKLQGLIFGTAKIRPPLMVNIGGSLSWCAESSPLRITQSLNVLRSMRVGSSEWTMEHGLEKQSFDHHWSPTSVAETQPIICIHMSISQSKCKVNGWVSAWWIGSQILGAWDDSMRPPWFHDFVARKNDINVGPPSDVNVGLETPWML